MYGNDTLIFSIQLSELAILYFTAEPFTQLNSSTFYYIISKYLRFSHLMAIFLFLFFMKSLFSQARFVPNHLAKSDFFKTG